MSMLKAEIMWIDEHEPKLQMKCHDLTQQNFSFHCSTWSTCYLKHPFLNDASSNVTGNTKYTRKPKKSKRGRKEDSRLADKGVTSKNEWLNHRMRQPLQIFKLPPPQFELRAKWLYRWNLNWQAIAQKDV